MWHSRRSQSHCVPLNSDANRHRAAACPPPTASAVPDYQPDWAAAGAEPTVDRFCSAYQLDVLRRIGGTAAEISHLASQDGPQCDVDRDGDCDYADYFNRDW